MYSFLPSSKEDEDSPVAQVRGAFVSLAVVLVIIGMMGLYYRSSEERGVKCSTMFYFCHVKWR